MSGSSFGQLRATICRTGSCCRPGWPSSSSGPLELANEPSCTCSSGLGCHFQRRARATSSRACSEGSGGLSSRFTSASNCGPFRIVSRPSSIGVAAADGGVRSVGLCEANAPKVPDTPVCRRVVRARVADFLGRCFMWATGHKCSPHWAWLLVGTLTGNVSVRISASNPNRSFAQIPDCASERSHLRAANPSASCSPLSKTPLRAARSRTHSGTPAQNPRRTANPLHRYGG
jgi:hypothetical protein